MATQPFPPPVIDSGSSRLQLTYQVLFLTSLVTACSSAPGFLPWKFFKTIAELLSKKFSFKVVLHYFIEKKCQVDRLNSNFKYAFLIMVANYKSESVFMCWHTFICLVFLLSNFHTNAKILGEEFMFSFFIILIQYFLIFHSYPSSFFLSSSHPPLSPFNLLSTPQRG